VNHQKKTKGQKMYLSPIFFKQKKTDWWKMARRKCIFTFCLLWN